MKLEEGTGLCAEEGCDFSRLIDFLVTDFEIEAPMASDLGNVVWLE